MKRATNNINMPDYEKEEFQKMKHEDDIFQAIPRIGGPQKEFSAEPFNKIDRLEKRINELEKRINELEKRKIRNKNWIDIKFAKIKRKFLKQIKLKGE